LWANREGVNMPLDFKNEVIKPITDNVCSVTEASRDLFGINVYLCGPWMKELECLVMRIYHL